MSPIDVGKLKRRRLARGLTQRALARAAQIHQPRIAELERGKAVTLTVEQLERLAQALGVRPAYLLTRRPLD